MDMKKILPPESAAATIFNRFAAEIGNGGLAEETRRVCILAALAACGGQAAFRAELCDAFDGGLSPAAAHETVLQAAAYLGYGRALPFLQILCEEFSARGIPVPAATEESAEERTARGERAQVEIFGEQMKGFASSGDEFSREINRFLSENCFGDYYVRAGLDYAQREAVTFCLLAAQGDCEPQLTSHAAANLRIGNDAQTLKALVLQMLPYIGYPRSLNALACVRKACEK